MKLDEVRSAMSKKVLSKNVCMLNCDLNCSDIERIIDILIGRVVECIVHGRRIELRGFGAFSIRNYESHAVYDMKMGAKLIANNRKRIYFRASKSLVRSVCTQ